MTLPSSQLTRRLCLLLAVSCTLFVTTAPTLTSRRSFYLPPITTAPMAAATVQSSTNLFRRLAWNATVPLEIRLDGTVSAGTQVDRFYVSLTIERRNHDEDCRLLISSTSHYDAEAS